MVMLGCRIGLRHSCGSSSIRDLGFVEAGKSDTWVHEYRGGGRDIIESGSIGLYSQRNNLRFIVSGWFVSREWMIVCGVFELYICNSFGSRVLCFFLPLRQGFILMMRIPRGSGAWV